MSDITIPIRCSCGEYHATLAPIDPTKGIRVVCHCDDCQAFVEFLGRADEILSDAGGTEIYQTTPQRYRIDSGLEHVACVSLKEKGLKRWYTSCCNTPIGNTMRAAKVASVGVPCVAIADSDQELTSKVGPIQAKVNGRFARGGCPEDVHPKAPAGMIWKWITAGFGSQMRGEAKPHPFFDDAKEPIVAARVLTPEERTALDHPAS